MRNSNPVVYSTESGRICPKCSRPIGLCICKSAKADQPFPSDGIVRVRREKQGRGGKEVTSIRGVPGTKDEIQKLAAEIKKKLGTGGTVRDGVIEIQGDRVDFVLSFLTNSGYKAKRDGG
jgi:translation initiation factor 1